jgi:putative mRNA 3-end processing factor
MVRWLAEQGLDARSFKTEYGDEDGEASPAATPAEPIAAPGGDASEVEREAAQGDDAEEAA